MSQEQRQQAVRDEKLVPSSDRVKISATNMRIEPTVPQKEETFQVVLDIIKYSPCFKAFTITADILGICPRVPNKDFVAPPSEEDLLTFLIELGYKGPLDHLARMFVDHMHQPWRTLATIINKKNVDYSELIWKDFAYQIDYMQAKLRRREIMPYLRFNHFLLLNPSILKGPSSGLHTIKDDEVISILKFIRIDVALELGKSMSLAEAEEEEAARRVYVTYERLVTEFDEPSGEPANRPTGRRRPSGIAFRDTSSVSNKKSPDQSQKLMGIQTLNAEEQLVVDIMC
ncbi:hypothetical protein Tco_1108819 [Tanacetum coccineum]